MVGSLALRIDLSGIIPVTTDLIPFDGRKTGLWRRYKELFIRWSDDLSG